MAINKEIQQSTGITLSYWEITKIELDIYSKQITFKVCGWLNKETYNDFRASQEYVKEVAMDIIEVNTAMSVDAIEEILEKYLLTLSPFNEN